MYSATVKAIADIEDAVNGQAMPLISGVILVPKNTTFVMSAGLQNSRCVLSKVCKHRSSADYGMQRAIRLFLIFGLNFFTLKLMITSEDD